VVTPVTLAQLSDIHFGRDVDLEQVAVLERLIADLNPDAVVLAGDLTQRARHGELQRALVFAQTLQRIAPVLVIPGNHDVEWWRSPLGILGSNRLYRKYRLYFGDDLAPRLELPGVVIGSALTSHGLSFASMTWNLNDLCVKGHLPRGEAARLTRYFQAAPPETARVVVMHHNVLPGAISHRMGLARWKTAQRRLRATGADLILCGHDHQEAVGQIDGVVVVSTSSAHTQPQAHRVRGGRPSAFNLITIDETSIAIQHLRWDAANRQFVPSDQARFGRHRSA
jgi:3',5'-cyclic AMP phosphodiesterase CpdA